MTDLVEVIQFRFKPVHEGCIVHLSFITIDRIIEEKGAFFQSSTEHFGKFLVEVDR